MTTPTGDVSISYQTRQQKPFLTLSWGELAWLFLLCHDLVIIALFNSSPHLLSHFFYHGIRQPWMGFDNPEWDMTTPNGIRQPLMESITYYLVIHSFIYSCIYSLIQSSISRHLEIHLLFYMWPFCHLSLGPEPGLDHNWDLHTYRSMLCRWIHQ